MFTWNTFLVVRLVGGKVRRIKMEKSKWEFSTYLVWWERGRMEEEVSEVSTWITKSHPPKLEGKVCEKMFITENLLFCPFWLQHFLFSTKKEKRKKKVTTFLLSLIIVIRIFHKIYSNQLSIFSTFHPIYQIHSGITFSIIQLFYASYIIYYISLCHP